MMFTENEMQLINDYKNKFGYNPMMEFAFYLEPKSILNLLIEANGREIIVNYSNDRLDYAKFSFKW